MKSQNLQLVKYIRNTLVKSLVASSFSLYIFAKTSSIVVAGGCFWCMEPPFDKLEGVTRTTSGYAGGHLKNPTYKDVSSGKSGHIEVVKIDYDNQKTSLSKIMEVFWRNVNPTDSGGQFVDRGYQYSTAVFYSTDEELTILNKSREDHQKFFKEKIVTDFIKLSDFYSAEDYHQNYYMKNPIRYKYYRYNSGRDQYLNKQWNKSSP